MINTNQQFKHILIWLITATTGGKNRAQIIKTLKNTPQNANQLATKLKLSYKTTTHHLNILQKNKLLTTTGNKYATIYFLTEQMEQNYETFKQLNNPKPNKKQTKTTNTLNTQQTTNNPTLLTQ